MRQRTQKCKSAMQMPLLPHSTDSKPFDIRESEVAQWLCSQPEIMQYIFDKASNPVDKGGFGYIKYDPTTKKWRGIDIQEVEG